MNSEYFVIFKRIYSPFEVALSLLEKQNLALDIIFKSPNLHAVTVSCSKETAEILKTMHYVSMVTLD